MTLSIWKFPFAVADEFSIDMPVGAKVLSVQDQNDQLCMWALVDPDADMKPRAFRLYGTGHPIETYGAMNTPYGTYIATVQQHGGDMVWHLFSVGGPV